MRLKTSHPGTSLTPDHASGAVARPSTGPQEPLTRDVIVVSLVAIFGAIMSILDATIVNVAIATLAHDFAASLSTIQWVATGYLLALALVIPMSGWAADRFGAKRVYLVSVVLFVTGSVFSGLAWSAGSLIAFRVVQGLGGGMVMPLAITIITRAARPQRIGRVMSIAGIPAMLAPMLGPVIGGWIVTDFSWRWIFFVNVPVGALAIALALRLIPADRAERADGMDAVGVALLSPGLVALVYGLAETAARGGFASPRVLIPIGTGLLLIGAFALHAIRTPKPLLDVRLLGIRAVAASSTTTMLFSVAFFGTLLLLPLYFQIVRGESALVAGLLLAPRGLGAVITLPVAGRMVDRSGSGKVVLVGVVISTLGLLPLTRAGADASYWALGATQFVQGMGLGMVMQPAMAAAYQALDSSAVARATSALNSIQRVGGSIGTALIAVVLEHQITAELPKSAAGGGLNAVQQVSPAVRAHLAPLLATAFDHTVWWAVALTLLALGPALFLPRTRSASGLSAPGAVDRASGARLN